MQSSTGIQHKAIFNDLCLYAEDQHSQKIFTWGNFTKYTQVDDDHTQNLWYSHQIEFHTWDAVTTSTQVVEAHSVFILRCNHQPESNIKAIFIDLPLMRRITIAKNFTWDNFTRYTQVDDDHTLISDAVINTNSILEMQLLQALKWLKSTQYLD